MSKIWHSGPPPSKGWWPASSLRNSDIFRWWNGTTWSVACTSKYSAAKAAQIARQASNSPATIEWKARPKNWPKRSMT